MVLVLSRWDSGDPVASRVSPKTAGVIRRPFRWHRLTVSWKVRLKFRTGQGSRWKMSSDLRSVWRAEAGSNRKIPGACFLFLATESCFLDGFMEDMSSGVMPEVAVPAAYVDCGVITKAVEDLAAQEAL